MNLNLHRISSIEIDEIETLPSGTKHQEIRFICEGATYSIAAFLTEEAEPLPKFKAGNSVFG